MLPRLLTSATVGAFIAGVLVERKAGRRSAYRAGYRDGWVQRRFDAEMDAANPNTGWADLYDVPFGDEQTCDRSEPC